MLFVLEGGSDASGSAVPDGDADADTPPNEKLGVLPADAADVPPNEKLGVLPTDSDVSSNEKLGEIPSAAGESPHSILGCLTGKGPVCLVLILGVVDFSGKSIHDNPEKGPIQHPRTPLW